MKKIVLFFIAAGMAVTNQSCQDRDYPDGLDEYAEHYYITYVPYSNAAVTVNRDQPDLLSFELQFNSAFTRGYDAVAHYEANTADVGTDPENLGEAAVLGEDYDIVDEQGQHVDAGSGVYSLTFPQAKKATAHIYIKLLNSSKPGKRSFMIDLVENQGDPWLVDIMSTSYRRTITIN